MKEVLLEIVSNKVINIIVIIVVINKIDLVSKLTKPEKVIEYATEINKKNIFVSALKHYYLDNLHSYLKGINTIIYFVGSSNSGKSLLNRSEFCSRLYRSLPYPESSLPGNSPCYG